MNIQTEKLELISWLANENDLTMIERVKWIKESQADQGDWWDEISEAEKASIKRGLKDAEEGRSHAHSKVRKLYEKWL